MRNIFISHNDRNQVLLSCKTPVSQSLCIWNIGCTIVYCCYCQLLVKKKKSPPSNILNWKIPTPNPDIRVRHAVPGQKQENNLPIHHHSQILKTQNTNLWWLWSMGPSYGSSHLHLCWWFWEILIVHLQVMTSRSRSEDWEVHFWKRVLMSLRNFHF